MFKKELRFHFRYQPNKILRKVVNPKLNCESNEQKEYWKRKL